ncbi:GlsB/YeaQ/YmgE family stress response membrane protein [Mastigocoleus sp. MO_188.B34]|uniref:GlsB/YeaQ/YmgE family stress response membrane protein n=1 Tax=Mastigocoleus sp. MO_188.B34 TaxID=3036635 RepID=UPI002635C056|nr:GlsB/YeaQ/YmgE family stress response membrane protein [Mastigocoleus sp. MO_188.B34]MDJ0694609.1 GlsB/YeaQ/YmgE family stress response membrane protein [Mastigocoleus sp. MO_188.B34]
MISVITWVILGFIAATLAKLFYPRRIVGKNISTIGLGIFGALLGGYLGQFLLESDSVVSASVGIFSVGNIFFAILGGMFLIFMCGLIARIN